MGAFLLVTFSIEGGAIDLDFIKKNILCYFLYFPTFSVFKFSVINDNKWENSGKSFLSKIIELFFEDVRYMSFKFLIPIH